MDDQQNKQFNLMRLNKYQTHALGFKKQAIEAHIWNANMARIYQKIDKRNKDLDDEGQTYQEFLEMEKQEPNQEGTGRFKFETISSIQYFFIPKGERKIKLSICNMSSINQFLHTFFRIPIQYSADRRLFLKENCLIDKQKGLEYFIKHEDQGLDVYDLLDVMMQYRKEKTILVGIIQSNLQQNGDSLDGRACGDGVVIIGFKPEDLTKNLEALLQTIIHQTLHALGFDHCLAWKCLMNAYTNFASWLCPVCSRKLYHQLKIENKEQVYNWLKEVLELMEKMNFHKSAKKYREIIGSID